jgi:7-alpha-hydroxysteroid dehydrogenase
MLLQGKVAIVTGGAGELGRAIAERLAREGADLVLVDRDASALEEAAVRVRRAGRRAVAVAGDVAEEVTAVEAVERAERDLGRIDILVNGADASGPAAFLEDIPLRAWDETLRVNVTAAFLFCKHTIPRMKRNGAGCIVSISSLAGVSGFGRLAPYGASKWALIGLTRSVALEAGPSGIRANTVCPGFLGGERTDPFIRPPLGRAASAHEVASAVLFLASGDAGAITGEELIVSAGLR